VIRDGTIGEKKNVWGDEVNERICGILKMVASVMKMSSVSKEEGGE